MDSRYQPEAKSLNEQDFFLSQRKEQQDKEQYEHGVVQRPK